MFYAVDRFEEHLAVLVDDEENTCIVEREALPADVRQGDVLRREEGGNRPPPGTNPPFGADAAGRMIPV